MFKSTKGAIGNLKRMVHGSCSYLEQIIFKTLLMQSHYKTVVPENKFSSIKLVNPVKKKVECEFAQQDYSNLRMRDVSHVLQSSRILINDFMFHSTSYSKKKDSNSFTVRFIRTQTANY